MEMYIFKVETLEIDLPLGGITLTPTNAINKITPTNAINKSKSKALMSNLLLSSTVVSEI